MFKLDVEARLAAWSALRKQISISESPFQELIDFWAHTPFTPHNHHIDPYHQASWATPWEIIVENKYDDFTKAVMMGYSLQLTDRYNKSNIQIRTLIDTEHNRLYNVVYVDDAWALNFDDNQVVSVNDIPSLFRLENLIELKRPR